MGSDLPCDHLKGSFKDVTFIEKFSLVLYICSVLLLLLLVIFVLCVLVVSSSLLSFVAFVDCLLCVCVLYNTALFIFFSVDRLLVVGQSDVDLRLCVETNKAIRL